MIPLVTLLAALLVDAGQRTEGRLHELRGRAGLRDPDDGLTPTQKRLLWILRSFPPEVSIRAFGLLVSTVPTLLTAAEATNSWEILRHRLAQALVDGDLHAKRLVNPAPPGSRQAMVVRDALVSQRAEVLTRDDYVALLARNVRELNWPYGGWGTSLPATMPSLVLTPWLPKIVGDLRSMAEASTEDFESTYRRYLALLQKIRDALPRIVDWAVATSPDLMSLTFRQAKWRSDRWHAQLAATEKAGGVLQGDVVYRFADGWTVQNLPTKKHLESEGDFQKHCVARAGYWDHVQRGELEIHSLRDPDGKPVITFEVRNIRPELRWREDNRGFHGITWRLDTERFAYEVDTISVEDTRPPEARTPGTYDWKGRIACVVSRRARAPGSVYEYLIRPPKARGDWSWDDPRYMTLEQAKAWIEAKVRAEETPDRRAVAQAKGYTDRLPGRVGSQGSKYRRQPREGEEEKVAEYVLHVQPDVRLVDPMGVEMFASRHGFWETDPDAFDGWLYSDNHHGMVPFVRGLGLVNLVAGESETLTRDVQGNTRAILLGNLRERHGLPRTISVHDIRESLPDGLREQYDRHHFGDDDAGEEDDE